MIALHSFLKRFHAIVFRFYTIFCCLSPCEFIRREYGFSINSKISFISSGYMPTLTESQSKAFADFDILQILIILLGHNSYSVEFFVKS